MINAVLMKPGIDLKELDEIVREIIFDKEDKPTEEEKEFYNEQWLPYMKKTNIVKSKKNENIRAAPSKVAQNKTSPKKTEDPKIQPQEENVGKKRIYEVAKEYGIKSSAILKILSAHNINKTNFSKVDGKDMKILSTSLLKGHK